MNCLLMKEPNWVLALAFQYPMAIPGVSVVNFLKAALRAVRGKDIHLLKNFAPN